jgi:hypothetical protein
MADDRGPRTPREIIGYLVSSIIAIWLIIWMLRLSGINLF